MIYKRSPSRKLSQDRYVEKNRKLLNKKSFERIEKHLDSWKDFFPKETECELCGRNIGFRNKKNPICFDHRCEGKESIKVSPHKWLVTHYCTRENMIIWKENNFGMLCRRCNGYLPTRKRKEFLDLALKYTQQNFN